MVQKVGANGLKTLASKMHVAWYPQKSCATMSSLAPSSPLADLRERTSLVNGWTEGSIPSPLHTSFIRLAVMHMLNVVER